jgi:creatinine amidohydrolase
MKGKLLSELSWNEAAPLIASGRVVVLPIGGGVKEHGHHLPLGTDMFVVQALAERILEACPVLVLPPLNYGYFPAFSHWPGSVSIEADTFRRFVGDIIRSFARHGSRRFLVLDGGVSTQPPLTILSYDLHNELGIEVAVTDIRGLGVETVREVCDSLEGGHANESETSCMLNLHPELVKLQAARAESVGGGHRLVGAAGVPKIQLKTRVNTPTGVNGDPTRAEARKGRLILDAMADDIVAFLATFAEEEHA